MVPFDERVARRAVIIGLEAQSRVLLADALIPATAQSLDAVLVHCDPHFE